MSWDYTTLLEIALKKTYEEGKIDAREFLRLTEMLQSEDKENIIVAEQIIKNLNNESKP